MVIMITSFIGGGGVCIIVASERPEHEIGVFYATGFIMVLVGLIIVCQVWCYRKSLETAIAIVDASANFFIDTKRIIGVSIGYFALSIVVFLSWVVMELFLTSLLDFRKSGGPQEKEMIFENRVLGLMFFVFVMCLWILAQIDDTQKYICMVSASTYYFDSNPTRNGNANV